ncbi:serine hydrolase [Micromonospora fluostatini]|uniref:serine hydrolase n=1 Tax=Micromonospora sp. JCM 30529 TaxID=3421643 RepID=UPI003D16EC80
MTGHAGTADQAATTGRARSAAARRTATALRRVAAGYARHRDRAGGTWRAYVSVTGPDGSPHEAVAEEPDTPVEAYSVNKIAVAVAVLDRVDRGLLALDQRIEVTEDLVVPGGDGIFALDGAWPSSVTLGHALATLLTVSDDTAVRLCGRLCPATDLNRVLRARGLGHTQVRPVADPHRFHLGTSTARGTHDLLRALATGGLLTAASTAYLLGLLRSPVAFTDGIRREMSSAERARVATKAGWYADGRHEAGIVFDRVGAPVLTYALFATGPTGADDVAATHPAVRARSRMGRPFLAAVDRLTGRAGGRPGAATMS